jgi:hypothetical protein
MNMWMAERTISPEEQGLMQARVVREQQRHEREEGFVPDVVCWSVDESEPDQRCHRLPIFHVKQLDGTCYYGCRKHAITLVTELDDIPLEVKHGSLQN